MKNLLITIMATLVCVGVYGQGTFQNLDFESGSAGWSAFFSSSNGIVQQPFFYDAVSLGGPLISIIDNASGSYQSLQGTYSVMLFGGNAGFNGPTSATISQTGLVPIGATSLLMDVQPFVSFNGFTVSLNGQSINLVALQTFPSYDLYSWDISAFAGQTAQLGITAPAIVAPPGGNPNGLMIDDIRFSPSPEPSVFALSALGALVIGRCIKGRRP